MAPKPMDFVHLHVHSDYSLLDGACTVAGLVGKAAQFKQPALALTDHGNMCGALNFYKEAKKRDVQPIVGCEVYLAEGARDERKRGYNHMTLLAKSLQGYRNLSKLSSLGYKEGFYYRPRIDMELLETYSEGIIALSGCLKGPISVPLVQGDEARAREVTGHLHSIFKDDFYLEIQPNDLEPQFVVNDGCIRLSRETGIPLVATCDIHYLEREDAEVQDVKICIASGKQLSQRDRLKINSDLYFRPTDDVARVFSKYPEAIYNTRAVAEKVDFTFPTGTYFLPRFEPPGGLSVEDYFEKVCREGLKQRYGTVEDVHNARLETEMTVIKNSGYVAYFLIVADFIEWARQNGIPVGPGRGSAAGSIVAYVMGITDLDPLKYDLLFERFLNPDRVSMPDIDIDFCEANRGRVIEYVRQKYGEECVTQIITFGTLKAKAVVRDVGRVMEVPLREVDKLAKMIPEGPKVNLKSAFEQTPELEDARRSDPVYEQLFSYAERLEGLNRHAGKHAAGVVISDINLLDRIPLYKVGDDFTTQFTMAEVEECGLLKMDFLGLRTLTVIDHAERMISKKLGKPFSVKDMPLDDRPTFEMMSRGETRGVFQLESSGFRELIVKVKPDRFEDIIALIALYRPGPLGSDMDKLYVNRKHGREEITYEHPTLEPILKETYGAILYQEQVMRIANQLAGFTMAEADTLRKAMGKKKIALMEKFKPKFVEGCRSEHDIDEAISTTIWDQIAFFAEYGFNKSHSAAYGLITYHTAWLKAHHPAEFMAALLTSFRSNVDKMVEYIDECRRMDIAITPPNVNTGDWNFSVHEGRIVYGLEAVKGVGHNAVAAIIEAREKLEAPFRSLFHFCEEVDPARVSRATIEQLIKAGAFDDFDGHRAQLLAAAEEAVAIGVSAQKEKNSNQIGLFGGFEEEEEDLKSMDETMLPKVDPWTSMELLTEEKGALGFYLSSHPLDEDRSLLDRYSSHLSHELKEAPDGTIVVVGGMVQAMRTMVDRKGNTMAFVTLEDPGGSIQAVIFGSVFADVRHVVLPDARIFLKGKVDMRRDEPQIIVDEVIPFAKAPETFRCQITFELSIEDTTEQLIDDLRLLLQQHSGRDPIQYDFVGKDGRRVGPFRVGSHLHVRATHVFEEELRALIGPGLEVRARAIVERRRKIEPERRFGRKK